MKLSQHTIHVVYFPLHGQSNRHVWTCIVEPCTMRLLFNLECCGCSALQCFLSILLDLPRKLVQIRGCVHSKCGFLFSFFFLFFLYIIKKNNNNKEFYTIYATKLFHLPDCTFSLSHVTFFPSLGLRWQRASPGMLFFKRHSRRI